MGALREGLIDLAAARLGGNALLASDEFFAPKSNLLEPGRGVFIEGRYTKRGKWMDGWETRRRRGPGYDWCIIRLGAPGVIRALTVDTNHFRGNHPAECSLDAVDLAGAPTARRLRALGGAWLERLPRAPLAGRSEEHTSELQSPCNLVCRLLLEKTSTASSCAAGRAPCPVCARRRWRRSCATRSPRG